MLDIINPTTIASLVSIGIAGVFSEMILDALGKLRWATFISIISFSTLGISAISCLIKFVQTIATLGY